jgi:glycine/D-amino acid oxidase-like deaminating enzyme
MKRYILSTPKAASAADQSWWLQDTAATAPRFPKLTSTISADVAIVGGGLTGLWTAIRLREKDPALRVVVLEANECGSGASGRNGGQVHSWFESLDRLASVTSTLEALELAQASAEAIEELQALQESGDLDMDLRLDGWLWTASSRAQEGAWDEAIDRGAEHGVNRYALADGAQLLARTGSSASYVAAVEERAGSLHPGKLMRSLARYAAATGVEIYEHSAAHTVTSTVRVTVETADGAVDAAKVLLATNVWASSIPELRSRMYIVDSEVIATEPIPERLDAMGWRNGESVCDGQAQVLYYQRTTGGRIVFGRGSGRTVFADRVGASLNRRRDGAAATVEEFRRVYPELADVKIDHDWTGAVDCVPSHVPQFGALTGTSNVFYAVGWNGTALAQIPACSRIIASMVAGSEDHYARSGLINQRRPKRLPPEPIRFIGANIVRFAVIRQNRAEIQNKRASWLTRSVLMLMPKGSTEHD